MARPYINVEIDFASGASFAYPLILDDLNYGILDTNVLGDAPADLVNITDQVMKVSTRRGRNRILANFEAGTATVTLNDPNSWFNPYNIDSPYFGKLLPLRKIRIYATTTLNGDPVEINLFAGYITSYDTGFYEGTNTTSTVVLQCVDGFRLLNNVSTGINPVPGCPAGQLSGARVNALLDFSGFPTSMRSINTGDSTMQADPGGARSILQAIQTVEQSEFGAFYMARSGEARFLDRNTVSVLADVTPRYYSDTAAPGSLPYASIDFAYDDQLILNDVTVTRNDDGIGPAVPQQVSNQESIDKYFLKSGQRTGILVQTDQEANDQARTLLVARKDADVRIDSMTVDIYADQSDESTVVNLSSDIYSLVVITKTMSGGSFIARELFIQGVQHDITPDNWITKLLTAEPIIQAFILDSTNQGILDVNNLSY
jgi:hypothetical protein